MTAVPAILALCSACTRTSAILLAADTIQVTASAAPICGVAGVQDVAIRYTAAETIRAGFDRFIVLGQSATSNVGIIGYTPLTERTTSTANAYGSGGHVSVNGHSTTKYSGGQPIVGGHHDDRLIIKMFCESDKAGTNAISARQFWEPIGSAR